MDSDPVESVLFSASISTKLYVIPVPVPVPYRTFLKKISNYYPNIKNYDRDAYDAEEKDKKM